MNLYKFEEAQFILFALIILRMIAFITTAGFFSSNNISVTAKVLLSIVLSFVIYPLVHLNQDQMNSLGNNIIALSFTEMLVGIVLGFLSRFFFFAVSMLGEVVSVAIGLGSAQLFNPMIGSSGTSIEQFHVILASLLFLIIGGHHYFILGIFQSYEVFNITNIGINLNSFADIVLFAKTLLSITVSMSAPILITAFLANVSMGIIGRAIPQMNVLVTSMPVNIMLGFFVLFLALPLLIGEMDNLLEVTTKELFAVIKTL